MAFSRSIFTFFSKLISASVCASVTYCQQHAYVLNYSCSSQFVKIRYCHLTSNRSVFRHLSWPFLSVLELRKENIFSSHKEEGRGGSFYNENWNHCKLKAKRERSNVGWTVMGSCGWCREKMHRKAFIIIFFYYHLLCHLEHCCVLPFLQFIHAVAVESLILKVSVIKQYLIVLVL